MAALHKVEIRLVCGGDPSRIAKIAIERLAKMCVAESRLERIARRKRLEPFV